MPSAKIILPDRIYKNGHSAFILQIIIDRKKYRHTLVSIDAEFIDRPKMQVKSKHPDAIKLNRKLVTKLAEAKTYLLECEEKQLPIDPDKFFRSGRVGDDIISHVKAKIATLVQDDKHRTAAKYGTVIMRIEEAGLNKKIYQVNSTWIKDFDRHLKKAGNVANTRAKLIGSLGSVFRQAKKDGAITVNPFDDHDKPSNDTTKQKLNMDEFRAIQEVPLSGQENVARNLWIFATLARGMRAHDILTLRWVNIQDGRVKYKSQKNAKDFDILLTPAMEKCLEGLSLKGEYVFPFVKLPYTTLVKDPKKYLGHVNSKNTLLNKYLKSISEKAKVKKHVTMHVARHTFAFISDQANIPLGTLQQLLGHSKMTTTMEYAKSLRRSEELDEAVEGLF